MPCFHPLQGWMGPGTGGNGKLVFDPEKSYFPFNPDLCRQEVACGQCLGCRLDKRLDWTIRCLHETKDHDRACFVTFTIDDDHMPPGQVVPYSVFQRFMKRLRKKFSGVVIRFFEAFEYGTQTERPHFHAILWGVDFAEDRKLYSKAGGNRLYTSETLEALWGLGFCTVGDVTQESISYVAGYTTKDYVPGAAGDPDPEGKYYGVVRNVQREIVNTESGEVFLLPREHVRMSRRPGIGASWWAKYGKEVMAAINEPDPKDPNIPGFRITTLGKHDPLTGGRSKARHRPVPDYYIKLLERDHPDLFEILKRKRKAAMNSPEARYENSPARLKVRKACLIGRGIKKRDKIK